MTNYFTIFDTRSEKYVNLHDIIYNNLEIKSEYPDADIRDHIIFTEELYYCYNGRKILIQDVDRWVRWRREEINSSIRKMGKGVGLVYSLTDVAESLLKEFVYVRVIMDIHNDRRVPNFLDSEPLLELYLTYKELVEDDRDGMWEI